MYTLPTVSGLRVNIAHQLSALYLENRDWNYCSKYAVVNNLFQMNKEASSKRYSAYLIKNLKSLEIDELSVLAGESVDDQNAVMWLAFCRTFPLVGKFAEEKLGPFYREKHFHIDIKDWNEFFLDMVDEYPYLSEIGEATLRKSRVVIFHNLRETEYLSSSSELNEAVISEELKNILRNDLKYYPIVF